jgi:hypothetical protein
MDSEQCNGWMMPERRVGGTVVGEMKHHRTVCGEDTSEKR